MALEFSTAGFKLKYAVETVAGTRPTSGYTDIPDVVSLAAMNSAPSAIDVTPLAETYKHRYIPGLSDDGGTYEVTANQTTTFQTAWDTLVSAAASGFASGYATHFEIVFPSSSGYTDSFYFTGLPSATGFAGAEVDQAYQGAAYITTNTIEGFATAST